MTTARRLSLTLVVALGLAWSLLLALGGAWVLGTGHALWGESWAPLTRSAGAAGMLGGTLVFLTCVADRVYPSASRRLVLLAEVPVCVFLFVGIGVVVWSAW
ncbi:MAG: hypothetical protein DHS20C14_12380 [Phycisphaeraceae bacterium]|nr:MAG: hypothetical protein DHS20C14_12380 [Phycisphaeraceae bacterium]